MYMFFCTGPNCTEIYQQLVEMKKEILEEIKAIKSNKTRGNGNVTKSSKFRIYNHRKFWRKILK